MLEHLVVYPRGGLCNRLRAIASAKRLCSQTGARCTIAWDWGDYRALFDDATDWIPYDAAMARNQNVIIPGYHHIRHRLSREGGTKRNHRVPVTAYPRVAVTSWYVFCAAEEPVLRGRKLYEEHVMEWFPKPNPSILEKVNAFHDAFLPARTVGIHVRRTDNKSAIFRSSDKAYLREGDRLMDRGHHLFLATDNEETLAMMQKHYGDKLISYPKSSALKHRWPKKSFNIQDITEDLVDLWLLASCEFVTGSIESSYSRVAILLNGSPHCKAIDDPVGKCRDLFHRMWACRSLLSPRRWL